MDKLKWSGASSLAINKSGLSRGPGLRLFQLDKEERCDFH